MNPQDPKDDAVDNQPLVGGEINIRLALSPGTITLVAAPLTVLATMLLGWLLLKSLGIPLYPGEMLAGAIVNTLGGLMASLPLFIRMQKGAAAIAQAGLLGIALRMGMVLLGLLIACAPAWGLDRIPLIFWVMGYYFPLLIVETAVVAWLCNKAKR
jgi:hypothetical protein